MLFVRFAIRETTGQKWRCKSVQGFVEKWSASLNNKRLVGPRQLRSLWILVRCLADFLNAAGMMPSKDPMTTSLARFEVPDELGACIPHL